MMSEATYAETIGETFIQIRGRGFDLSPIDLDLISRWQEKGVPLFIPLNVLAAVEEYRQEKPELRVRGLSFIKEEVEARFSELLESHVGCGGCDRPYCAPRSLSKS